MSVVDVGLVVGDREFLRAYCRAVRRHVDGLVGGYPAQQAPKAMQADTCGNR